MALKADRIANIQAEDFGIFHDIDSKNYIRTFIRNEVRPDGRNLTEARKVKIATGDGPSVLTETELII